ncbi:MAG: clan AA aspartic protease [Cyanobacteria bacterium P01_F01_bin.150]
MMQGHVNQQCEAVISVAVQGGDKIKSINATIDTGFNGFLTLPIAIITELGLSWNYRDRAALGDGSETLFDVYKVEVIWNGEYRELEVNAVKTEPLLGMRMLKGYRLQADTIEGSWVTIEILPNVS